MLWWWLKLFTKSFRSTILPLSSRPSSGNYNPEVAHLWRLYRLSPFGRRVASDLRWFLVLAPALWVPKNYICLGLCFPKIHQTLPNSALCMPEAKLDHAIWQDLSDGCNLRLILVTAEEYWIISFIPGWSYKLIKNISRGSRIHTSWFINKTIDASGVITRRNSSPIKFRKYRG